MGVTLVRDKKTKRPRGMGFVTLACKNVAAGDAIDDFNSTVDRLTAESQTINGVEVEIQEALPKIPDAEPHDRGVTERDTCDAEAAPESDSVEPPATPAEEDPAALAQSQAQWQ